MGLDDGHAPCPVRLLGVCPEKAVVVIFSLLRGGGILSY
jgi:hypothetical protein